MLGRREKILEAGRVVVRCRQRCSRRRQTEPHGSARESRGAASVHAKNDNRLPILICHQHISRRHSGCSGPHNAPHLLLAPDGGRLAMILLGAVFPQAREGGESPRRPNNPLNPQLPLRTPPLRAHRQVRPEPLVKPEPHVRHVRTLCRVPASLSPGTGPHVCADRRTGTSVSRLCRHDAVATRALGSVQRFVCNC